jgi:hypothetical protein
MRLSPLLMICLATVSLQSFGQKIVYTEPEKDDSRRMNFEIIGKVSGNFLIYKNTQAKNYIAVYNADMEQTGKEYHNYMPEERLTDVGFLPFNDFAYMLYQYHKKNVVYAMISKIDGNGKLVGEARLIDTTHLNSSGNNKVYSALISDDKSKIMLFKINSKNKSKFIVSTLLMDNQLTELKRSRFLVPMEEYNDYLDEFNVDNDGDLVFTRFTRNNNNETIVAVELLWKKALSDTVDKISIDLKEKLLDEIHIKVDNANRRYFVSSFYYTSKRSNVEGMYFHMWDKQTKEVVLDETFVISEDLRKEARGESNTKMAFNDYFIKNVIIKKDGGFLLNTESFYTSSRFRNWNRWNYLYGPSNTYDYYSTYSPYYNTYYWRNRNDNSQAVRYHADNLTILSFDKNARLQWHNVITKTQYDDEGDDRISFQLVNTGGRLHYIFNVEEKRTLLLNDFTLGPDGQVSHNPTLKHLDKGYEFLPKYGKQVGANQIIVPCFFRNYICFAKIEFN